MRELTGWSARVADLGVAAAGLGPDQALEGLGEGEDHVAGGAALRA